MADEKGQKISQMADHTGPLTGTVIPLVDTDGMNRKFDGGTLVQLGDDGKIDPDLLPPADNTSTGSGIFVVSDL